MKIGERGEKITFFTAIYCKTQRDLLCYTKGVFSLKWGERLIMLLDLQRFRMWFSVPRKERLQWLN